MDKFMEVIQNVAPIISVLASSLISYVVAKAEAKNEIKKVMLQFNHEDNIKISEAFQELLTVSNYFCLYEDDFERILSF